MAGPSALAKPAIIEGGVVVDDRGQLTFVNEFDFHGVRRFYMVSNHVAGFVRAWHAHKREAKYVFVVRGAAKIGAVAIDDWDRPSPHAEVHQYVLSASAPRILYIPAGYANGFMTLTPETQLMFFSTATLAESREDDFRFEARYWDPWHVEER
jgi:dTDP-4-dehydrorhamnose 3,5-epimerase-like enzyme